jgi:hypothetical protein
MPIDTEKKGFARRIWNAVRSGLESEVFRAKMLAAHAHHDYAARAKKLQQCFSSLQFSHMVGRGLTAATRRRYKSRALKHVDRFTRPLFSSDSAVTVAQIEGSGLGAVATRDAQGTLKSLLEDQADLFGEIDFKSEAEMAQLMELGNKCSYDGCGGNTGVVYGPLALLNTDQKNMLALKCSRSSSSNSTRASALSTVYTDDRPHARVGVRVVGVQKGASRGAQKLTLKQGKEVTLSYGSAYTRRVTRQQQQQQP